MNPDRQRALEEQLALEISRTEKLRATIMALAFTSGFVIALLIFQVWLKRLPSGFGAVFLRVSPIVMTGVGLMTIYGWLARLYISRYVARQKRVPLGFVLINAGFEVSAVSFFILLIARASSPAFAISAPPILIYSLLIMMSVLRLDFWLSLFVAVMVAIQYVLLGRLLLPAVPIEGELGLLMSPIPLYLRAGIFMITGLAAGVIGNDLRHRLIRTTEIVVEKDRAVAMFGQHVSPQVAEQLLREHTGVLTETRHVCILFLDIRNFTRFAESRTPSEVVDYLNALFGPLVEIVDRHGGIINKFLGDGFLAIFGAPLANDQHCLSAVRAALAMLQKVEELGAAQLIPPTRLGIGLHAGMVVTGSVGSHLRREYTVIGDAVNLAARIEQLTKVHSAQLLASDSVIAHLPVEEIATEKLALVQVKGREAPVQIFKLA
ncbi:MAG: adenylate/guanylate cyclase domain-containing protein [Myxococcales bacterium]|jgi:adenylate cyclase|nr:adenylate/guanylate cyclase domain-containing protein [Myxococcales bacterium]